MNHFAGFREGRSHLAEKKEAFVFSSVTVIEKQVSERCFLIFRNDTIFFHRSKINPDINNVKDTQRSNHTTFIEFCLLISENIFVTLLKIQNRYSISFLFVSSYRCPCKNQADPKIKVDNLFFPKEFCFTNVYIICMFYSINIFLNGIGWLRKTIFKLISRSLQLRYGHFL